MQPLKGLTVVTLEHAIAAPFATRQLADLGARVIKIERPGVGDFARGYDQRVRGLASHFVWTNRSKESLTLDVKHPQAAALLEQLIVSKADVVVQNLAPGAAARLGVSFEALKERRPDLIVCDISGYGDDLAHPGPYRDKKAYDLPRRGAGRQVLHHHVGLAHDELFEQRRGLRMLHVQREAFLAAIRPDEMGCQAAHALVVAAREVAAARALDLDHTRTEVGQLARRKGRRDGVFEGDDGKAQ